MLWSARIGTNRCKTGSYFYNFAKCNITQVPYMKLEFQPFSAGSSPEGRMQVGVIQGYYYSSFALTAPE